MVTDKEIIDALRGEDRELQARTIEALHGQIKLPLIHFVVANGGSREEAIVLLQDVIVALFQRVNREDFELYPASKLSTYAQSIGRQLWLKDLQLRKVRQRLEANDNEMPTRDASPLDVMIDREKHERFWRAFSKLGSGCQRVIQLTLEERSHEEIAKELGFTNIGSTRVKRAKCMDQLRALYDAESDAIELDSDA